jgi:hypothetical protein
MKEEEQAALEAIADQDAEIEEDIADVEAQQQREEELALLQEQVGEAELESAQIGEEEQAALEAIADQDAEMEEDIADVEAQQQRGRVDIA